MTIQQEKLNDRPPDTLGAILDIVTEWRNGGISQYGPEALVVLNYLEDARHAGALSLQRTAELTA